MNNILKGLALDEVTRSIIMVAGVGGAGGNALNHMVEMGINDVTFLATNTDAQALEKSLAQIKIQLGSGLGAGNMPELGQQAAKESIDDIINVFRTEGTKMLFITAGMGGGTGTGASPIIARAARELDILTVAIVTTPFTDEGPVRTMQARAGIEELRQYTDSLLVLSNDSIAELYPDLPYDEGFGKADDVLATAVKGIAEIITGHGTVNVDFKDVNTVMRGSGRAFMGSARAAGSDRALEAVESSVTSLLLNHSDIKGAKDILLNISYGDRTVTQREASTIRGYLQERTGWTANLIWGTAHKESLGEDLELTIIATGFPGGADEVVSVPPPRPAAVQSGALLPGADFDGEAEFGDEPRGESSRAADTHVNRVAEVAADAMASGSTDGGRQTDHVGARIYTPQPDPVSAGASARESHAGRESHIGREAYAARESLVGRPRSTTTSTAPTPASPGTGTGVRAGAGAAPVAPRAGTVQWRGKDRYVDIDNLASTPAWVRRKAKLTNPYEGRPAGKAALKDSHKEAASGASDQETDETPKSQPSTLF